MVWLRRMFIVFCITTCIPTAVAQTASLGTISFSTVPIPAPLQSALPNKTASGIFNTVQQNGSWISQPNDQLVSALQSQYALVSASPLPEQFAQLSAIVIDSQSTVQKRGAVLALEGLYYAVVWTMIAITALSKAVKLSGVNVNSPGSLIQDLQGSPPVIVADVNGEVFSVTVTSQTPTATAIASASSAVSSSAPFWPCAGTSCRSSGDIPTATPYTCNLPGRSGDACGLMYTDMYSYTVASDTAYSMDIASLTSALAVYSSMPSMPFTTLAPTACQMTAAASICQSQSVCLCSGVYTLPRTTTVSGGQISTDCSYYVMPSASTCPTTTPQTTLATSTVASSTPPPAPTSMPPPPPTMGAVVCTPWLNAYSKCHKDMDVKKLNETAECLVQNQIGGAASMTSTTPYNYTEVYNAASGVSYIANVGWIPGCTTYASQNPTYPSGDTSDENWTYNIIYWNWLHCTGNQGLAGYTDFGCLRIGTFPNRLSGVLGAPPHPNVYFSQEIYC